MRSRLSTLAATIVITFVITTGGNSASAAFLRDVQVTVVQPDGVPLLLYATGDEFSRAIHDKRGYRITLNEDGWPVYAVVRGGKLVPTSIKVRGGNPSGLLSWWKGVRRDLSYAEPRFASRSTVEWSYPVAQHRAAPASVENIVVFVRFADDPQFSLSLEHYEGLHNTGYVSLGGYYRTISGGAVNVRSTFYPASPDEWVVAYQDTHERGYYQPRTVQNPDGYRNDMEIVYREQSLVARAVNAIAEQVPADLNLDADGDGMVDSVELIVYGQPDGWSDLLWPHRWVLYAASASIGGKEVYGFTFQLDAILDVSMLAHEMGHALGAPDLYRYPDCSSAYRVYPVYEWDVMAHNAEGTPQWPLSLTRWLYLGIGAEPMLIASNTRITLRPNDAVQVAAPNGERVYVEYRPQAGYDAGLPSGGLLVYRANSGIEDGNRCGPPDAVWVYRPGSTSATVQGQPQDAALGEYGRMQDMWLSDGSTLGVLVYGAGTNPDGISIGISWRGVIRPRLEIPRKPEGS